MSIKNHLFSANDWSSFAARQRERLEEEIGTLNGDRMLNTSILDLSHHFAEKYKVNVPTLHKDQIVVDQREAQIDVSHDRTRYTTERSRPFLVTGTVVEVSVPFEGEAECFATQPTTFTFNPPNGDVEGERLIFHIEGVGLTIDQVRAQIQQTLNEVTQNLRFLHGDAERFNSNLFSYAHALIAQRRRKLFTDRNLVSGLGYKLKERADEPPLDVALAPRQMLKPLLPQASTAPYKPEPVLAAKDFTRILELIQQSAKLLMYSPSIVSAMDEELLRAHILVHLNAHFESKNIREVFSFASKSDILIRAEGKCIFIAECKFWAGPSLLTETLEQILSYSSWRDTKAALILFHRNNSFALMLEILRATLKSHSNFKHELPQLSETVFPYVYAHHEDRNREMLLTALAFALPKPG